MNKKNNSPKNNSTDKAKPKSRLLKGRVVSDKMDKTIVVLVSRLKKHSRYQKRYKVDKKYKVDDRENKYKNGDRLIVKEVKPVSKTKRWQVIKKI